MMQSVIILGNKEQSKEKALEILQETKISKFDVNTFTSEKAIGILDIRSLQKNIILKPGYSEKKAVIIETFNGMTVDAQNSFLKVLEEPPQNTIILILTSSLDFILPTVLSRCNLINLIKHDAYKKDTDNVNVINLILDDKESPLVIAQNYGKDKETALIFLESLIFSIEENLNSNNQLAKILKKIQKTHTIIKSTNINVRFALENLFLNLKSNIIAP